MMIIIKRFNSVLRTKPLLYPRDFYTLGPNFGNVRITTEPVKVLRSMKRGRGKISLIAVLGMTVEPTLGLHT
jgi:hypothetical protein